MSNDERSSDTPETILLCGEKESVVYVVLIGVDWYNCTAPSSACGNDVELFKQWLDGVKTNKKVYCMTLCREDLNGFSFYDTQDDPNNPPSHDTQDDPNNPPSHDTHDEFSDFSLHHIIDKKLDYVIPLPNEKDKLIIVFSGHGFEAGGDSYLAPGDLIVTKHGEYDVRTAISYRELTARLNKCKAKFKWLIINACRDEVKIIEDNSLSSLSLDSSPDPKNCVVLRSCQSGEKSWTNESVCKSSGSNYANELIYSIFIWYLVDALDGAADFDKDGKITMKDVIEYVEKQTQTEADKMGVEQKPWFSSSFNNLEDVVIISKKTEGMTPDEFKKGQELISKAQERFNVAKEQEPKVAIILLEQASEYVREALNLIPKPSEKAVNPKDGKHKSEWKGLLRKIDNLKSSKGMSMAQPSSRKEVDSRIALVHQDLPRRLVEIQNVLQIVPPIQLPIEVSMRTVEKEVQSDKRNSLQPQEQNIDPYDENDIQRIKDQKIEPLDNQNSQQNENQRLPLNDDNIQQTNVSKRDIRPSVNQMKNGESDSAG